MLQSLFRPVLRPIMMGVMSVTGSRRAWTPAALWPTGTEAGAWYDPSDLSTMFQDSAGTTPVTAAGQPVGLILDKSGNGHHASQSTSTARPLLVDDDGVLGLKFDGVDDYLSTAAIDFTGTDQMTVFAGVSRETNNIYAGIVSLAANVSVAGSALFWWRSAAGGGQLEAYGKGSLSATNGVVIGDSSLAIPGPYVFSTIYDMGQSTVASEIVIRKDGALMPTTGSGDCGTGTFANGVLTIGSYNGGAFLHGNLYSLIIAGALYDAATVIEAETWVAEKTGVTL